MHAQLQAAGVESQLYLMPGGHGSHVFTDPALLRVCLEFLDHHLQPATTLARK